MKDKKPQKVEQENFLTSQFVDENQTRIPDGFETIKTDISGVR